MNNANSKQIRKLIIILVVIVGAIWGGYAAYQAFITSKRGTLIFESVPGDLILTANSKRIAANGKQTFQPGAYKLVAKRAGFSDLQRDITVKRGETQKIFLYLDPNSEEGERWLREHPNDAVKREGQKGAEQKQASNQAVEKNEFIRELPFIGPGFLFRIDYGPSEEGSKYPDQPTIFIQGASADAHNMALQWMRSHGYDPDTMNIVLQLKQPE